MGSTQKIGQVFTVNGSYIPKRASVYLKPNIISTVSYFTLGTTLTIDSTNFSSIERGLNIIRPNDSISGYTGKSYMENKVYDVSYTNSKLIFPVKATSSGTYHVWIRGQMLSTNYDINVYVDDVVYSSTISTGPDLTWQWYNTDITIPDTNIHDIKIEPTFDGMIIDKIHIKSAGGTPTTPAFDISPFLTIHGQIYTLDINDKPSTALYIHDYKTSLLDVSQEGWYNFDCSFLSLTESIAFNDEKYVFVLFATGTDNDNYILWQSGNNDTFSSYNFSAIKY